MAIVALSQALLTGASGWASAAEVTLFSGGIAGWQTRFGQFGSGGPMAIVPQAGEPTVDSHLAPGCPSVMVMSPPAFHAEAQRAGVIGADFAYTADLTVASGAEAHLQFRIADQGRYGVRLRPDGAAFYRLERLPETCDCADSSVFTHCPSWPPPPPLPSSGQPQPTACSLGCDDPQYQELATAPLSLIPGSIHELSIRAVGSSFQVFLDGQPLFPGGVTDDTLRVGRFGIYAFAPSKPDLAQLRFGNVRAFADPTRLSNFALLYSTPGYEPAGTKRALVRTLNDLPTTQYVPQASRFYLTRCLAGRGPADACVGPVSTGLLAPMAAPGGSTPAKTFGMQLWEADFSALAMEEGTYSLRVTIGTTTGVRSLSTAPFEVRAGLASATLLKPLSILNADARRAADDDMRRNWCFETATRCTNNPAFRGPWSVALDGAFWADRADANTGAVLRRVFNDFNEPVEVVYPYPDFRYVGQITIINGCDAQMQFRITPRERLAVTLQAGAGGGCPLGGGPGAVRLHREGSSVPGGFQILAATPFPSSQPFQAGHPYDVDILAQGGTVTVSVDNGLVRLEQGDVPSHGGGFALKAFASTARFARVQAWASSVVFRKSPDGTRVPLYNDVVNTSTVGRVTELVPCQDFVHYLDPQTHLPLDHHPLSASEEHNACYPWFAQLTGFHDANNVIGEATSHGTFLAGLMDLWADRASGFSPAERESLRHAIQADALYIEGLYQEGGAIGEFAHSEMGRGGVDTNLGPYQSGTALYGNSAFADKGAFVDRALARQACLESIQGAKWLSDNGLFGDPTQKAIVYAHIARCSEREGISGAPTWDDAANAADAVLEAYKPYDPSAVPPGGAYLLYPRDTGRVVPWFEGVYEVFQSHPEKLQNTALLASIADLLVSHLTRVHPCNDLTRGGHLCPPNGFFVIPQGSGDQTISTQDWFDMEGTPLVNRPVAGPGSTDPEAPGFLNWYNIQGHFPSAASDSVYLWRMTGNRGLERIASGNYYWMLGLNPGVPSQKVVGGIDQVPWRAAAFITNLDSAFSHVFEGYRTVQTSSKGWLAPWEGGPASPHREFWFVDPASNGFRSTVNGHVIWDGQWDYWDVGKYGWASGETFILGDGAFLKAALLYEDRLSPAPRLNPYDTTHLAFFDTTHVDRIDSLWPFDDPDFSLYAQASRASTGFCDDKGFNGGRFTGHHIGERDGLLCTPTTAKFFDATDAQINATGWGFADINTAPWAQVARAATGFCNTRGFVGGFATGHPLNGLRGIVCLGSDVAHWFDSTQQDLYNSGEGFADINTVPWAKAARAATNICLGKGYSGGFFTGHQLDGMHGVVCLQQ